MTVTSHPGIYYDPYDFDIDADPYPLWKRIRDEAPLYWNEKYEFFALGRWADVEAVMLDWDTYRSGRGSILEMIRANVEIPSGVILMEDPPVHTGHRSLPLAGLHAQEDAGARAPGPCLLCRGLDPLVDAGGFDFIEDLGKFMPMRVIGMLLGIPEQDQVAIRERLDQSLRLEEGTEPESDYDAVESAQVFSDYITWRAEHPSDDLMTRADQRRVRGRRGRRAPWRTTRSSPTSGFCPGRGTRRRHVSSASPGRFSAAIPTNAASWRRILAHPQRHRRALALRGAVARAGPLRPA